MNVFDLLPVFVVVSLFLLLTSIVTSAELSSMLKTRYNVPLWRSKLGLIVTLIFVLLTPVCGVFLFREWNCGLPFFSSGLLGLYILISFLVNLRRFPRPDGLAAAWAQSLTLCATYCLGTLPALFVAIAAGALGPPGCS